jgi:hypothetical protein
MNQATGASSPELVTSQASVGGWYGGVGILLAVILVAPIWAVEYPPLVDYPNHLARGFILYHFKDDSSFSEYLEIDYRPIPNLAIDFFLLALQPFCDVRLAGKLFLTITLWLLLAGWHLLGCAIHGKPTWLALGGALVAYHSMFLYGFANFSLGLGIFLVAFAAWLHWRDNWAWWRLLLVTILALSCYFSHLSALIFLAGTALAVTFWDTLQRRGITLTRIVGLAPVLLPFALLFFCGGGGASSEWNFPLKLVGALCMFLGYNRHIDAAFIAAVAVFLILLGVWSFRVRANGGVLFAGLGCVFMFLVGPYQVLGGSPADARFLPPAAALISVSLDLILPRKKALALLGLFVALVVFRYATIGAYWLNFQSDLRDQVESFQSFPEHAKVYPMVNVPDQPEERKLGLASFHLIQYAVIDRQIYTPHLLAFAGQQPIRYKTPPIAFHADAERFTDVADVDWNDWNKVFASYDYLWGWHLPDVYHHFLQRRCTLVAEKGNSTIWRVKLRPANSVK